MLSKHLPKKLKLGLLKISLVFIATPTFAKDPVIVWPSDIRASRLISQNIFGDWVVYSNADFAQVSLNRVQNTIKIEVRGSNQRLAFFGYLLPIRNAYYGSLRSTRPGEETLRCLLYNSDDGIKVRLFFDNGEFEDLQLQRGPDFTQRLKN